MKKCIFVCFSVIFLFFAMIQAAYADLSMFQPTISATKNYSDVAADAWYAASIQQGTAMGLLEGYEDGKFNPQRSISLAEAASIAVRVYETYHQETSVSTIAANAESTEPEADLEAIDEFENVDLEAEETTTIPSKNIPWYQETIEKAIAYQILPQDWQDYERSIKRGEAAYLFYHALPDTELSVLNQIDTLPDVSEDASYVGSVKALYAAGVLTGDDAYGAFHPEEEISRAEISALVVRLVDPSARKTFVLKEEPVIKPVIYGKSGYGRDLQANQIGDGRHVMILVFCLHGYEDHWPKDGQALVQLGEDLGNRLAQENVLMEKDWTVYIIPCANPDGLNDGWSSNGPGRCTTHLLKPDGSIVYGNGYGVDLNRCFEYGFRQLDNSRNYTGSSPLGATEAVTLKNFILDVKSTEGKTVLLDIHGWTQQIIAKNTEGQLAQIFKKQFPQNRLTPNGAHGYLTEWTQSIGIDSVLFEFPSDVYSWQQLLDKGYQTKFYQGILDILARY